MDIVLNIVFSIVLICIFLIWFIATYNRFQNCLIRINEAEAEIDATLRKRFDLLNKSIGIIKSNTNKESVLEELANLRSKKLTNFELDRKIYEAINEISTLKEEFKDLKKCEGFMKIELGINETEAEIIASRKYYNDIITDYNKMVKSLPSNIIAKICKFKSKNYFDGKSIEHKTDLKI